MYGATDQLSRNNMEDTAGRERRRPYAASPLFRGADDVRHIPRGGSGPYTAERIGCGVSTRSVFYGEGVAHAGNYLLYGEPFGFPVRNS